MDIPKFLIGYNTDHPDAIFVVHTEFPRFIIDLATDQIEWLEEFDAQDQKELARRERMRLANIRQKTKAALVIQLAWRK